MNSDSTIWINEDNVLWGIFIHEMILIWSYLAKIQWKMEKNHEKAQIGSFPFDI